MCSNLFNEVVDVNVRDDLQKLLALIRMLVEPLFGLGLSLGAAALDHVAEERPLREKDALLLFINYYYYTKKH